MEQALAIIKRLWLKEMMNQGQPLIDEVSDFLTQAWLDGELPFDLVDYWTLMILHCPEGEDGHGEDGRVWCAYCGGVATAWCQGCETWFPEDKYPEDYAQIKKTCDATSRYKLSDGYCIKCWFRLNHWKPGWLWEDCEAIRQADRRFHLRYGENTYGLVCMTCRSEQPKLLYFGGFMECYPCARYNKDRSVIDVE